MLSPSHRMFERETKTSLNTVQEQLKPLGTEQVSQNLLKARLNQKTCGDTHTNTRKNLKIDDESVITNTWSSMGHRQHCGRQHSSKICTCPRRRRSSLSSPHILKGTKAKVATPTQLSSSLPQGEEVNRPTESRVTKIPENTAVATRSVRLIKKPVCLNLYERGCHISCSYVFILATLTHT